MKRLLFVAFCAGASAAFAYPSVSAVTVRMGRSSDTVRISYILGNEPAVVTLGLYDKTTGEKFDESLYNTLDGDVNRMVQNGNGSRTIVWTKSQAWKSKEINDMNVGVTVRAWATNCPPDYVVISLTNKTEAVRYYTSTDAFPASAPFGSDCYKLTHLVMRKIPAANREFRMGSPAQEPGRATDGRENMHYVILSADYYMGIYPITHGQYSNVYYATSSAERGMASANLGFWSTTEYAAQRRDDWPYASYAFGNLRSYMHETTCTEQSTANYVDYKFWPRDGHELTPYLSEKCGCTQYPGRWSPPLWNFRRNYGFEFDIPTEAQWEFACRAGTNNRGYFHDQHVRYNSQMPTNINEYAWTVLNSTDETANCPLPHSVGLLKPNYFGLYDMIGNVWEWVLDQYKSGNTSGNWPAIASEPVTDPQGFTSERWDRDSRCMLKGGSFISDISYCRPSAKMLKDPAGANGEIGTAAGYSGVQARLWVYGFRLVAPAIATR